MQTITQDTLESARVIGLWIENWAIARQARRLGLPNNPETARCDRFVKCRLQRGFVLAMENQ